MFILLWYQCFQQLYGSLNVMVMLPLNACSNASIKCYGYPVYRTNASSNCISTASFVSEWLGRLSANLVFCWIIQRL